MTRVDRRQTLLGAITFAVTTALPRSAMAADPSYLRFVHPELRPAARRFIAGDFSWATRATSSTVPVREVRIEGPSGAPPVTVFVVNERAGTTRPAILHTHGGGFIGGSAKENIRFLQDVTGALDCVAVTVDYRIAPQTRFSGSTEDNYAGLRWLYRNAREIGADRDRVAVMGESAGGGHAALLAIRARDRAEIPLIFQCLTYPMLDDRTGTTRKVPANVGVLVWDSASNRRGWSAFLGQDPGSASVPRAAVPARTQSFHGLPPAFIGTGDIDLFVDEDIEYARRLLAAGVSTELNVVPGAFHGFDLVGPEASITEQFKQARLAALRRAFA